MPARFALLCGLLLLAVGCSKSGGRLALIDGSCEHARPIGDAGNYTTQLRARKTDTGFIRVRADANWPSETMANVLGTIPSGTLLWAEGPLKDAGVSDGIGYAILIRDPAGHTGRGYVSATVIDVISASAN